MRIFRNLFRRPSQGSVENTKLQPHENKPDQVSKGFFSFVASLFGRSKSLKGRVAKQSGSRLFGFFKKSVKKETALPKIQTDDQIRAYAKSIVAKDNREETRGAMQKFAKEGKLFEFLTALREEPDPKLEGSFFLSDKDMRGFRDKDQLCEIFEIDKSSLTVDQFDQLKMMQTDVK